MGALLGFLVGWTVGARAGPAQYKEVVDAARAVRQSEEFSALLGITRSHLASALGELSRLVAGTSAAEPGDLVNRVRQMSKLRVM